MKKVWTLFATILISIISINIVGAKIMEQNQQILTAKQQSMIKIAALTAAGNLVQLKSALSEGLNAGMTVNEISDELVQMYAYSGFPRSINGITTFATVLNERKVQGIKDTQGRVASPVTDTRDKYSRGKATLEILINGTDPGKSAGIGAINPQIETFLKEHLFADIFASDLLSYQQRELATVSALASVQGLEPMLQAHINMALNTGITQIQLQELINIIGQIIDPKLAQSATVVFKQVIASRN